MRSISRSFQGNQTSPHGSVKKQSVLRLRTKMILSLKPLCAKTPLCDLKHKHMHCRPENKQIKIYMYQQCDWQTLEMRGGGGTRSSHSVISPAAKAYCVMAKETRDSAAARGHQAAAGHLRKPHPPLGKPARGLGFMRRPRNGNGIGKASGW